MNNWKNQKTNEEVLSINKTERIGQTNKSKYGFLMTIIEYRNASDIDIQFEDGTIVKHKTYKNFCKGNIFKTNNDLKLIRIGETNINSDGLAMCIIDYRVVKDIDIKFEDGTIVTHKDYYAFKRGHIKNPNYKKLKNKSTLNKNNIIEKSTKVGETNIAKNGQQMTIIAYRSVKDIDIQFEDGTIVYNKRYQHFLNGEINNPNKITFSNQLKTNRIGEIVTTKDGIRMTIIEYRNRDDIDIQLDDNFILKHQKYERFIIGKINCSSYIKRKKIGETRLNSNGQKMTIIKYRKATDVDVEFEDGYIVKHIRYKKFVESKLYRPMPYMIGNIQVEQKAYNYKDEQNVFYICKHCHYHDIGTIKDIINHTCKENI